MAKNTWLKALHGGIKPKLKFLYMKNMHLHKQGVCTMMFISALFKIVKENHDYLWKLVAIYRMI